MHVVWACSERDGEGGGLKVPPVGCVESGRERKGQGKGGVGVSKVKKSFAEWAAGLAR